MVTDRGCLTLVITISAVLGFVAIGGWFFLTVVLTDFSDWKEAEGEQRLSSELAQIGVRARPLKFRAGAHDSVFSGRNSYWFKFTMPPTDVDSLEADIKRTWSDHRENGTVQAGASPPSAEGPRWWHPAELPDAFTLTLTPYPGYSLTVSRRTGEAYLFCSGH